MQYCPHNQTHSRTRSSWWWTCFPVTKSSQIITIYLYLSWILFGFFTLADKHGESSVMHRIWRNFFLESLTCSPLHKVTAPIIRMWFQLKSRTCNVSFMAGIKSRKMFIKRWKSYYWHKHHFYIKFYPLSAFPICIAPDSSISLLLRFNHTMLTFPYKSKVISLFVWSKTCSRISNLYRYVFPSEIVFSVTLPHLHVETRHPT